MTAANPVRRYMAQVEFLLARETIDSLLAQGFSKKIVHERLTTEGRCTMNYITFCKLIRNAKAGKLPPLPSPQQAENRQAVQPPSRPQRPPGIIKAESKTFPDPRDMNPNDSF